MIVVHTVLLNWLWWFLPHRLWSQKLCESPTNFKPRKKKSRRIQRRSKSTRHYHIWFPMLLRSVLWISFVTKTLHIFRNISLRLIVDLYSPVILMDDVSWFSLIWFVKRSLLLHLCISISAPTVHTSIPLRKFWLPMLVDVVSFPLVEENSLQGFSICQKSFPPLLCANAQH